MTHVVSYGCRLEVCLRENTAIGGVVTQVSHVFEASEHKVLASVTWDEPAYRAEAGAELHPVESLIFLDDTSDFVGQLKETSGPGIIVGQVVTVWEGQLCHFLDFVDDDAGLLRPLHPSAVVTEQIDLPEEDDEEEMEMEMEEAGAEEFAPESFASEEPTSEMSAFQVASEMSPEAPIEG